MHTPAQIVAAAMLMAALASCTGGGDNANTPPPRAVYGITLTERTVRCPVADERTVGRTPNVSLPADIVTTFWVCTSRQGNDSPPTPAAIAVERSDPRFMALLDAVTIDTTRPTPSTAEGTSCALEDANRPRVIFFATTMDDGRPTYELHFPLDRCQHYPSAFVSAVAAIVAPAPSPSVSLP